MSTNTHDYPSQLPLPPGPIPSDGARKPLYGDIVRAGKRPATSVLPAHSFVPQTAKVGLSDICLSYKTQSGERLLALDHINLQVKPGEFVCIVGPSGCGKSTLLHLIAGLHPQTSGQVLVDGHPVQGTGTDRILIFQEHGLFPWLKVGENVEFGMKMKGVGKAEREEKTAYYLRLVHLAKFKDSYIHQLSGGMRQRVAIARALATEPDVLLMDEPFAALDAQTRDLLHDELERIWSETGETGRTIIFVTHNVREAIRLGDRVVLLTFRPGRVKNEFPVDLPRPRVLEDVDVARAAREILDELREEINRSLEAEYNVGIKPTVKVGAEQ
jgi:NitT/TauT family transport system ATP-binding protein